MKTSTVVIALFAALVLAACGGGGGGEGSTASSTAPSTAATDSTPPQRPDQDNVPLETQGGDNSIQEFGTEASASERKAAGAALHGYLDARAAHEWRGACSYFAPSVSASLAQLVKEEKAKGGVCPAALEALSATIPQTSLDEAARADVVALRSEGDRGFLLFRGAHGTNYFVPMVKEGGAWKVAAIAPSALS